MTHTPTPWINEGDDAMEGVPFIHITASPGNENFRSIAHVQPNHEVGYKFSLSDEDKANAAFIVRACNAHDELVAIIKERLESCQTTDHEGIVHDWVKRARAALAAAEAK